MIETRTSVFAGYAAIIVVTFLILIKSYAYYESGAVSVLSSLVDSVLDSLVSVMALSSIYYARRPADADHRWGHGKMEAVSALFQSAVIVGGGVFLVFEAIDGFVHPVVVTHHMIGIYVMAISVILSILLVFIQRRALQHSQSLAIEADSVHYGSDVLINAGTLIVLGLGLFGAPLWIDGLFAMFVAFFMAYMARGIAVKSLNMLLDRELSDDDRRKIIEIIEAHEGVAGWHDLRTHRNGSDYIMSFDIEVDPNITLWAAHEIAKELENSILQVYTSAEILIHIDPEGYTEDARHRVKGVHI
ncbi:MAG: cation diffusion facilitator family transporter [Alphaproteobacteria bacterium]